MGISIIWSSFSIFLNGKNHPKPNAIAEMGFFFATSCDFFLQFTLYQPTSSNFCSRHKCNFCFYFLPLRHTSIRFQSEVFHQSKCNNYWHHNNWPSPSDNFLCPIWAPILPLCISVVNLRKRYWSSVSCRAYRHCLPF